MFSGALFDRLDAARTGRVTKEQFLPFWEARLAEADTAQRAFEVLRREGVPYITHADMKPLMLDLLVRSERGPSALTPVRNSDCFSLSLGHAPRP